MRCIKVNNGSSSYYANVRQVLAPSTRKSICSLVLIYCVSWKNNYQSFFSRQGYILLARTFGIFGRNWRYTLGRVLCCGDDKLRQRSGHLHAVNTLRAKNIKRPPLWLDVVMDVDLYGFCILYNNSILVFISLCG